MKRLSGIAFLLILLVNSVSAYIRLAQAGSGCVPWPECYAQVGMQAEIPLLATGLHRLSASILGVMVILLAYLSVQRRKQRSAAIGALLVTLGLASLGSRSGGLDIPAVVLGNYLGGLLLAALLGWIYLRSDAPARAHCDRPGMLAVVFTIAGGVIMTGILSSAFYGNAGCSAEFDCAPLNPALNPSLASLSTSPFMTALFAPLEQTSSGHVVVDSSAATVQWLHRCAGLAIVVALTAATLLARKERTGPWSAAVSIALVISVTTSMIGLFGAGHYAVPISLGVIHSLSGLALIMALLLAFNPKLHRAGQ